MKAGSFSEIPAYKAILKHRGLAKSFGLVDPFYKRHDARSGAHIWIGDTRYANFASSGHATNVSTIATLLNNDELILHDELVHNSVLIGAKLSQATVRSFRHNDLNTLEKLLEQNRTLHKQALIAVEGLYSIDGDVPNLPRLIELKERFGA